MPAKKILFTVLNWGLGHATRSIPLIRHLQAQGHEIILASDGRAKMLLEEEFPHLKCISLPAYNIDYGGKNMVWSIAQQLPKITAAVFKEKRQTQSIVHKEKINGIISDNRFGTYSKQVPSAIISHQINILTPYQWLDPVAKQMNLFWLKKFDHIWVPDQESPPHLSGSLSHPIPNKNIKYLGPLSRMKKENIPSKYHFIAVLSGPEPQRTFLEEKILQQVQDIEEAFLIVQGKTESFSERKIGKKGKIISYLTSKKLNQAINESELVIARSGYSTIMDLAALGKKAILIPTPGQTEQEYLAENLGAQNTFVVAPQDRFHLAKALSKISQSTGFQNTFDDNQYKNVLDDWLKQL